MQIGFTVRNSAMEASYKIEELSTTSTDCRRENYRAYTVTKGSTSLNFFLNTLNANSVGNIPEGLVP
jgi:hypothetical protein